MFSLCWIHQPRLWRLDSCRPVMFDNPAAQQIRIQSMRQCDGGNRDARPLAGRNHFGLEFGAVSAPPASAGLEFILGSVHVST